MLAMPAAGGECGARRGEREDAIDGNDKGWKRIRRERRGPRRGEEGEVEHDEARVSRGGARAKRGVLAKIEEMGWCERVGLLAFCPLLPQGCQLLESQPSKNDLTATSL